MLALSVLREPNYSELLVILPAKAVFDWHDHPKMLGFTKCLMGKIKIEAIEVTLLRRKSETSYFYPKNKVKTEII